MFTINTTNTKTVDTLTKSEQKKLISVFNTRYTTPVRNKTMIIFLLNSGVTLSEMINLKWTDIDFETSKIRVIGGKNLKNRIIWISGFTLKSLKEWRKRQLKDWGDAEIVFSTRTLNKLDGKAVRKMIATYTKKAGIKKHITTHSFRYMYAYNLLQKTNNLEIVQRALGHKNIANTHEYIFVQSSRF